MCPCRIAGAAVPEPGWRREKKAEPAGSRLDAVKENKKPQKKEKNPTLNMFKVCFVGINCNVIYYLLNVVIRYL